MVVRTYGNIVFKEDEWLIQSAEPHVRIKLKSIFGKIPKTASPPYGFSNTPENCADLHWFIQRYPLSIPEEDKKRLDQQTSLNTELINAKETILLPGYKPGKIKIKKPHKARKYQLKAVEVFDIQKRMLLADEYGLGKTLTSILAMFDKKRLPALVVVKTHLPNQWKVEGFEHYTNLKVHIIDGTKPYNLPEADAYIIKYSCLDGWVDLFHTKFFKYIVFDEVQELRTGCTSNKGVAARVLSENAEYVLGMSATPIYNYGIEIFNIMNIIKPGCLGSGQDFAREWTGHNEDGVVMHAEALGTYLRDNFLMLRRTREDVNMELPVINKIIQYVDYDEDKVESSLELARMLAMRVVGGSFEQSGQAARELDMMLRQLTGVSKARHVAAYVKILLQAGEPVMLAGWHRQVYDIWNKELAVYNPVMYTGSESDVQKRRSLTEFKAGRSPLLIISLRSGDGIDGLQYLCNHIVYGELDWSPKVHDQIAARLDRPGQKQQVTAHFIVTDWGSDPPIIDLLALKSSQAHNIVDPLKAVGEQFTDEGRIKKLAKAFLEAQNPGTLAHTG